MPIYYAVTTAPADYDYKTNNVKTLFAIDHDKKTYRLLKMSCDEYQLKGQLARYQSGLHLGIDALHIKNYVPMEIASDILKQLQARLEIKKYSIYEIGHYDNSNKYTEELVINDKNEFRGFWVQNFVGTLDQALDKAHEYREPNKERKEHYAVTTETTAIPAISEGYVSKKALATTLED